MSEEFICPVEGCGQRFGSWDELETHYKEVHNQNINRVAYDEWRKETTPTITTTTTELPFVCPTCGKGFASVQALRGHCAGTGHPFPPELKKPKGKPPREPKPITEKPRKVDKIVDAGKLPEEYDYLYTLMTEFGVKNPKPIADLMSRLDWDNYYALAEYLDLSGVRNDRIALIIESWSKHLGVAVPEDLAEHLKVPRHGSEYDRRGYSGYGGTSRRDGELRQARDEGYRQARIEQRLKGIEDHLQNLGRDDSSEAYKRMIEHNANLQLENIKTKYEYELKLTNQRIDFMQKSQGDVMLNRVDKGLQRVGDVGERVVNTFEGIVRAGAIKTGVIKPEQAPQRERGGQGGIADIMEQMGGGAYISRGPKRHLADEVE